MESDKDPEEQATTSNKELLSTHTKYKDTALAHRYIGCREPLYTLYTFTMQPSQSYTLASMRPNTSYARASKHKETLWLHKRIEYVEVQLVGR